MLQKYSYNKLNTITSSKLIQEVFAKIKLTTEVSPSKESSVCRSKSSGGESGVAGVLGGASVSTEIVVEIR